MSSNKEDAVGASGANHRLRKGARWRTFALVGALVGVVAVMTPARAQADYAVQQCVPSAVPFTDAGAVPSGAYSIWAVNTCGTDRGLQLDTGSNTGWTANGAELAWRFTASGGTSFTSATTTLHYGNDGGFAAASFSNGPSGFNVFGNCATPSTCWANPAASGGTIFEVRLQCFKSPNCHSDWAYAWITNFIAVVHDGSPPGITAGGPLLSGAVVRGVEDLQTTATDYGGGVRSVSVYVNGIYSRGVDLCPPNYGTDYTALKPCPGATSSQLAIDTQKDPGWTNGPNDVVICSTDVGGNASLPCVRRSVVVDNSCPGSGGTAATDLNAGADVGGQPKARAAVTSNVQPVIRGSLKDGAGGPVAGATVCIYETIDLPDASRELLNAVTTQGNGRFATKLDAGPSRKVDLIYRYNDKVLGEQVQLDSRVVPTLEIEKKSLVNGDAARFSGQVPGPNSEGRAVALQARVGRKWRTFKVLRTDTDGRFRGKYRFTQTTGRVRYVFRALVKRQGGYPYDPGGSRKRTLVVHG
jgi:hypothetical protein